ncbi:MAG: response regulator [Terracidiphilus sp.]
MSATNRVRILSISDDDGLRMSRELVLESDGYELESLSSNGHLAVAKVQSFEIAIVCQSVDGGRATRLAEMLRCYNPSIRILRIGRDSFQFDPYYYDVGCDAIAGPRALLNAVKSLLDKKNPARES